MSKTRRHRPAAAAVVLVLLFSAALATGGGARESTKANRMTVGFLEPLETLAMDGGSMYTNWGCLYYMLVYDNLEHFGRPPDFYSFRPRLVERYEISEDRTTWVLHLVRNATWHDGKPLTAEDVKFTFEHLIARDEWTDVDVAFDTIEVLDPYTLKVTNTRAMSGSNAPGWWKWDPIIPKHIFEPHKDNVPGFANRRAVGSGPFKLKEFKPGQYMWLQANDAYWGGRPAIDEVVFRQYGSIDTLIMALRKGDIDTFGDVPIPPHLVKDLEGDPNITVQQVPGLVLEWLSFNLHKQTPLQDKVVRQAIQYAINRDRIISMVYRGYAEKYNSWVYAEDPVYNPNLPAYEYDLARARGLLDEAGYTDTDGDGVRNAPSGAPLSFEMICAADDSYGVNTGRLIKENLAEAGIAVDLKTMDYDTFFAVVYAPADDGYEIALSDEEPAPTPLADWIWLEAQSWEAGGEDWNSSYYSNPRLDELIEQLTSAASLEERRAISHEMQAIMAEDLPYAFLVRPKWISAYRTDRLQGWVNHVGGPVSWINPFSILEVKPKQP